MSLVAQSDEIQLKRAQVSEEESKVAPKRECLALKLPSACEGMGGPGEPHPVTLQTAAGGISHAGQRGKFFFQAEVGMNPETTQVTARNFVRLPIGRQQQGATARSTDQGGNCHFQAEFGLNPDPSTAHVTVRQVARLPMGRQQQRMIASSHQQIKQFGPGGCFLVRGGAAGSRLVFCILHAHLFFVFLLFFFVFHCR